MQYIGTLMRSLDVAPIEQALMEIEQGAYRQAQALGKLGRDEEAATLLELAAEKEQLAVRLEALTGARIVSMPRRCAASTFSLGQPWRSRPEASSSWLSLLMSRVTVKPHPAATWARSMPWP